MNFMLSWNVQHFNFTFFSSSLPCCVHSKPHQSIPEAADCRWSIETNSGVIFSRLNKKKKKTEKTSSSHHESRARM